MYVHNKYSYIEFHFLLYEDKDIFKIYQTVELILKWPQSIILMCTSAYTDNLQYLLFKSRVFLSLFTKHFYFQKIKKLLKSI